MTLDRHFGLSLTQRVKLIVDIGPAEIKTRRKVHVVAVFGLVSYIGKLALACE